MSRVVITGATGLIGSALVRELGAQGHTVVALSRDAGRAARKLGSGVEVVTWADPAGAPPPSGALRGADAVVNLQGESISQRWSTEVKRRIRESRVVSTRNLVAGLAKLGQEERPKRLVSQSATGYYGPRGDEELPESAGPGDGFLADVVREWEAEAQAAGDLGIRVALTRTGVVLATQGGALEKLLPPFRLGIGGPVGGGKQYLPWVHISDVTGAMGFCLSQETASGPLNLTAPTPVTNLDFSKALGRVLHRPAFLPVPGLALKLLYGEMAQIILTGQRVVPRRLGELGYRFRQPDLEPALRDVLGA